MSMSIVRYYLCTAVLYLSGCGNPPRPSHPEQQYTEMDMQPILDRAKNAQIVSFGEYHALEKRLYPYITHELESQRLTEDILPGMSSLGFTDIVIEGLFSDVNQEEIEYFMQNGRARRNSLLEFNLGEFPDPNIMQLMSAFRRYGFEIHAGGISSEQYLSRMQVELASKNNDDPTIAAALYELNITEIETITENMKSTIDSLASEGRRVISFSGIKHNNCDPRREVLYDEVFEALTDERREISVSFGSGLYQKYGNNYLEVDLVAPETLDTIEVNGAMERIVNEMVPYEYILLSIVSRGHGLIRYQGETENRILTIFNLSRNRNH